MHGSRRLVAITAVLIGIAAWGLASPAAAAQSDTVVIELSFVTAAGEPPEVGVAVLDVNTGIEYRNDRVSLGGAIEVDAISGVSSELQIRRTALQPGAVSCEGASEPATVAGSRVIVTPGDDPVVCTVTLLEDLPVPDELPVTGISLELGLIGATVVGLGAAVVGASRSAND